MAHHNTNEDAAEDYAAAFASLPEVLQSAALGIVRAAQSLSDEQALDTRIRLRAPVHPEGPLDGATADIITAAAMVVEGQYDELRADNP